MSHPTPCTTNAVAVSPVNATVTTAATAATAPNACTSGLQPLRGEAALCPWQSSLTDLLHLLGNDLSAQLAARDAASRLKVSLRRVPAGQHLVLVGAPAVALYFVRTGTFKTSRNDEEGYEQVLSFSGRGEVLAYDALCASVYPTSSVALEDSTVFGILRSDLREFGRQVPAFEQELHRAGSLALSRSNDLVDVMAAVSSEVRLARFLLQHSRRLAAKGQSPRRFLLRMGRRDLASLLGVAHETVSRSFTTLAVAGLLHVNDRDVEIMNMDGLKAYARCTRKPPEDALLSRVRNPATARRSAQESAGVQRLLA